MLSFVINFIHGYTNVEIEGYNIEKFINTCRKNDIYFWGINRIRTTILKAKISTTNIEKIKEIARKNQCIITVKNGKGIPNLWERYKKRKGFAISLLAMILTIFILSKFVWNIEVIGTEKINNSEILEEARKCGLKVGTLKNKLDTQSLINKIRLDRSDIAWIGVDIIGTNAIIKIAEAEEKPEIIDENDFNNIVATKDGVITKIYAQNGTVIAKEGDEVKKGDILIAGWMEGLYTEKQYVNASGVAKAKIKYSKNKIIDKKEIIREQSGKKERKISIKFNNFRINFYKMLSKFEKYDTIYTEKKLQLFPNFYLPICFIKQINYEVSENEQINDYETAKSKAEQEIKHEMDGLIKDEIINSTTDVTEYSSYYNVNVTYEVIEDIGTKEKINKWKDGWYGG